MTCSAMKGDSDNCEEVERAIKVFITMHSKFDDDINNAEGNKDEVPRWITSCNFINLLNTPNQLKLYETIQDAWEGGMLSEKHVQTPKHHFKSFKQNWESTLLRKIYKEHALNAVNKHD